MSSARLITDEANVHFSNPSQKYLVYQKNIYVSPLPKGKVVIVGFVQHALNNGIIPPIVYAAIKNNIGVLYVCDKMPDTPIISDKIVYIQVSWKWLIHTLFMNPLKFKGVFHNNKTVKLAKAFSSFTKYKIPVINTIEDVKDFSVEYDQRKKCVLLEIVGGVGDHLLCIPTLQTIKKEGNEVHVLCAEHRKDCFKNLNLVTKFYTRRDQVDVSKFDSIRLLHFGQILNDYRMDLNKQNRIYAVAGLCGYNKVDLITDTPQIKFSEAEVKNAKEKWGGYSNKIFLGFASDRSDTKMSFEKAQHIINKLKSMGFTVFISSLKRFELKHCVNLTRQLNLREFFSLINEMDYVLTIDSSFMHIAGTLGKKTFTLMNYFDPEWRCSTYKNMTVYTPKVDCFPCVSGQYVTSLKRKCLVGGSCFNFFNWNKIFSDIEYAKNNK